MSSFSRAFHGEIYTTLHRRGVQLAHLAVCLVAALQVGVARLRLGLQHAQGGPAPGESVAWNAWARFAEGSRIGLLVAELLTIVLLANTLPREAEWGVVRDPLARRISRGMLILAKVSVALLLPLSLALAAVAGAWFSSHGLFEAGPAIEDGWLLVQEEEIVLELRLALFHGIASLMALGVFAILISSRLVGVASAITAALTLVLFAALFKSGRGTWSDHLFTSTLPGLGPLSFLKEAAKYAEGASDAMRPGDGIPLSSWWTPFPQAGIAIAASLLFFRRRRL